MLIKFHFYYILEFTLYFHFFFHSLDTVPRDTYANGKPKGKQLFEFPSYNRNVDLHFFPLSYQNVHHGQIQSDKLKIPCVTHLLVIHHPKVTSKD